MSVGALASQIYSFPSYQNDCQESLSITQDWKNLLKDEASSLFYERSTIGWDGYEARPISHESLQYTISLIELLSDNIIQPELVPEPSGLIGFEWNIGAKKVFSITVYEDGVVIFAGLFGKNKKIHGEEPFRSYELPEQIKTVLSKHFHK